ncbi:MAG: SDR family oxidoreductase [Pseudomonadota bacterium]
MTGAVLILGATSDIGRAIAQAYAARGHAIQLAARNPEALEPAAKDLRLRHNVDVTCHRFDALDLDSHGDFVTALPVLPEIAVSAVGLMRAQPESERDPGAGIVVMRSNFEGPAHIFAHLANAFAARGSGTLIGISSVAGDRGRASNYTYGAAKAGFTAYLSGLRNRLNDDGVHVLTVLPGFVRTQMTDGMDLPARLTAEPDEVAAAVLRAAERGKNILYVRPIWWLVMAIIRNIPEAIFKRLKI